MTAVIRGAAPASTINSDGDAGHREAIEELRTALLDLGIHPGQLRRPRGVLAGDDQHPVEDLDRPTTFGQHRPDDFGPAIVEGRERLGRGCTEISQETIEAVAETGRRFVVHS